MEKTLNQNIDVVDKKKKFSLFTIFIIILVLILFIAGYYYYKGYIQKINIVNSITDSQQDGGGITVEESVFGKIKDSDLDLESTADTANVNIVRKATLNAMMVGPSVFRVPENETSPYLPDNCIVLEYAEFGTTGSFVLIGSTDKEYYYRVGDKVDFFNYNFLAQNVVVLTEENTYKTLKDLGITNLSEHINLNSRLVFSCAPSSCNSGDVSWILVLMRDLNL